MSSDFIVVANRLPVDRSMDKSTGQSIWTPSPGGLVTALRPVLEANDGAWVGWPGSTEPVHAEDMPSADELGISMIPVNLDAKDFADFYEGFSNATLWPLYHDLIVAPTYDRSWWRRYREVNERFADAVADEIAEGGTVWVQDYQLHLVPERIRARRPDARIGFFLHIPFPNAELFRQLPWRRQILQGTLGADVVGFHTQDSARNFLLTLRALGYKVDLFGSPDSANFVRGARLPDEDSLQGHIVGQAQVPVESDGGSTSADGAEPGATRTVEVGVFPISIDSASVRRQASTPDTIAAAKQLRAQLGNPKVLIAGVDRMDYTKGILHRLEALEELLDSGRLNAADVVMVQVATPSRERLEDYQRSREAVERIVSRINGNHGRLGQTVVHYIHSGLPFNELVALYAAADLLLVTALKDGMNLVAKEYVAAHYDGSGALVLSEFTGAATQLVEAYLCNPFDVESIAATILRALGDDEDEKNRRMAAMWDHVREHDVDRWASTFLAALDPAHEGKHV